MENPNDGKHEIMAIARSSWARGVDAKSALKSLKQIQECRAKDVKYAVVPKGAWLDDLGRGINWELKDHPAEKCAHCSY